MKKFLSVIMVLVMSVCVFGACSKKESNNGDVSTDAHVEALTEEQVVENTVNECMSSLLTGDATALNYVKADSNAYSEMKNVLDVFEKNAELFKGLGSEMGISEEYYSVAEEIATKAMNDIFSCAGVEIKDVKIEDNKATVKYVMSMPDVENLGAKLTEDFMESMISDLLTPEALMEMQKEMEGMSEEELEEYKNEFMIEIFEKIISAMVDLATENVVTEEGIFELVKEGDSWYITTNK